MSEWGGWSADDYWPEPDEPSLSLIAKWHDEGRTCRDCATQFTEAHGHKVACTYCWKRLTDEERAEVPKAIHPEVQREGWAAINRTKRERKNAK